MKIIGIGMVSAVALMGFLKLGGNVESDAFRATSAPYETKQQEKENLIEIQRNGCTVDDWNYRNANGAGVRVEGSATCEKGRIAYRFYTSDGETFLASGHAYIRGGVWVTYIDYYHPGGMGAKFNIVQN